MASTEQKNAYYSALLGWSPELLGEDDNGPSLADKVRHQQRESELTVDGVCGPITYGSILDREFAQWRAQPRQASPSDRLAEAGRMVVNRAKRLWLENVRDPPRSGGSEAARARIDELIRGADGLGWTWEPPYLADGDFEWCGAFCAHVWGLVGLAPRWRKTYFASTYRLDRYARYLQVSDEPNPRPVEWPRRHLALTETSSAIDVEFASSDDGDASRDPRPGDILLVGPCDKDYGSHVCLVERYDAGTGLFTTVEGNGTGRAPTGVVQHGIVRGERPVGLRPGIKRARYHARRLIRPAVGDLVFD